MKVWVLHVHERFTGPIKVANTFGCDKRKSHLKLSRRRMMFPSDIRTLLKSFGGNSKLAKQAPKSGRKQFEIPLMMYLETFVCRCTNLHLLH